MFPKTAAEYVYTKKAFNRKFISFMVSWIFIIALILSGATVALGFAGYFSFLFGGDIITIAALLIAAVSGISYIGLRESTKFNIFSTLTETVGLLIIIVLGMIFLFSGSASNADFFQFPSAGIVGVISATALIFFAYIGFEELVNMSEETKNASKVVPKALVLALIISTILYILVSISSIMIVGSETLASSSAPLTTVAMHALGQNGVYLMSIIALFATANTVMIIFMVIARMLYGIARQGAFPKVLAVINERGTPGHAVGIVMCLGILALFLGGIQTIALLTDAGIFISYLFVNSSLIYLRYSKPKLKRPFKSPINIGKFPVLALLGLLSSFFMLSFIENVDVLWMQAVIIIAGIALYKIMNW